MSPRHHIALAAALALVGFGLWPIAAQSEGIAGYRRVVPERGQVAAASITSSTAGTAITVVTTTKDTVLVSIENTTDVELMVTRNGADFKRVPAGGFRVFDLQSSGVAFGPYIWGVYRIGTPASGVIEILTLPSR